jgi:hypothetical protein
MLETFMVNHLPGTATPVNAQSQQPSGEKTTAGGESLF